MRGLHHVTALAGDPQQNVDFYTQVLGQRLVKVTVNFDDPGTYHLYFGDYTGSPGSIMTFFAWPHAPQGAAGAGEPVAVSYAASPASMAFWEERLQSRGIQTTRSTRFGEAVIRFADPDGMPLEIAADASQPQMAVWPRSPVPEEHALKGFHSVTLQVADADDTVKLLTQELGFSVAAEEDDGGALRIRLQAADGAAGSKIDLAVRPGGRGRMGRGSIHHIAFRAADDDEQAALRKALTAAGMAVTDVRDRNYFRSVYFREPGGVLFEIATDPPGFTVDEEAADLGRQLKLPEWLEGERGRIERGLLPFVNREHGIRIGGGA